MKHRTADNYNEFPTKGETNNSPSMTIVGQSYTIRELLEANSRGQMLSQNQDMEFEEEPSFNTNPLQSPERDLTDVENIKNTITENLNQIKKITEKQQKQKSIKGDEKAQKKENFGLKDNDEAERKEAEKTSKTQKI